MGRVNLEGGGGLDQGTSPFDGRGAADLGDVGQACRVAAKGVFTVTPPDQELLADDNGHPLLTGSPPLSTRGRPDLLYAETSKGSSRLRTPTLVDAEPTPCASCWLIAQHEGGTWHLRIRNAFILAPIKEENDEEEAIYALYPPKVFQLVKVQNATQLWRVDRALYGFCRSPRLWGRFRDKRLRAAKIPFEEGYLYLKQHRADENIW